MEYLQGILLRKIVLFLNSTHRCGYCIFFSEYTRKCKQLLLRHGARRRDAGMRHLFTLLILYHSVRLWGLNFQQVYRYYVLYTNTRT